MRLVGSVGFFYPQSLYTPLLNNFPNIFFLLDFCFDDRAAYLIRVGFAFFGISLLFFQVFSCLSPQSEEAFHSFKFIKKNMQKNIDFHLKIFPSFPNFSKGGKPPPARTQD